MIVVSVRGTLVSTRFTYPGVIVPEFPDTPSSMVITASAFPSLDSNMTFVRHAVKVSIYPATVATEDKILISVDFLYNVNMFTHAHIIQRGGLTQDREWLIVPNSELLAVQRVELDVGLALVVLDTLDDDRVAVAALDFHALFELGGDDVHCSPFPLNYLQTTPCRP